MKTQTNKRVKRVDDKQPKNTDSDSSTYNQLLTKTIPII